MQGGDRVTWDRDRRRIGGWPNIIEVKILYNISIILCDVSYQVFTKYEG